MQQAAEPPERDYAQHPYLKRMQFRGGGYAILMALHLRSKQTDHRQFMYKSRDQLWTNLLLVRLGMFKSNPARPCFCYLHWRAKPSEWFPVLRSEILHDAQPFCDGIMEGTWGSANGWTSIRSLLSHRLVLACRGPFGGREEYRLTKEGVSFIEAMLELWPEAQRNASLDQDAVGQQDWMKLDVTTI